MIPAPARSGVTDSDSDYHEAKVLRTPLSRPFSRFFTRHFHSRNLGRPPILYHREAWRVSPSLTTGPVTRRASYPEAPGTGLIASLCRDDPGPRSFEKQERRSSEHMPQGRVKWYSAELGYGFILPYNGGRSYSCAARTCPTAGSGVSRRASR